MNYKLHEIAKGIELVSVKANQFKTNEISVSLSLPIKKDMMSVNALAVDYLSRRSDKYPDMLELNKKLSSLYGAALCAKSIKIGDNQVLKLCITCLDDRFSLDNESICFECVKLLTQMLLEPKCDNGSFSKNDVENEKRILIEKIESIENEKRAYALERAEEIMFSNEPYGVCSFGTKEQVNEITADSAYLAWSNMIKSAKILFTIVGTADELQVSEYLKAAFNNIQREYIAPAVSHPIPSTCIKEEIERIDVNQGKLVLGYRVDLEPNAPQRFAMKVFCDVFGGGPYSKLFTNVREKLSLCYYCSARYNSQKSAILIQCGCNEENMDKAIDEISNQLEIIKSGDFEQELNSSLISIIDLMKSVNDASELIENWYNMQIIDEYIKSPEEVMEMYKNITAQDIQECAQLIKLDTIYKLSSPKEEA